MNLNSTKYTPKKTFLRGLKNTIVTFLVLKYSQTTTEKKVVFYAGTDTDFSNVFDFMYFIFKTVCACFNNNLLKWCSTKSLAHNALQNWEMLL